jgi:hypothetical protein
MAMKVRAFSGEVQADFGDARRGVREPADVQASVTFRQA